MSFLASVQCLPLHRSRRISGDDTRRAACPASGFSRVSRGDNGARYRHETMPSVGALASVPRGAGAAPSAHRVHCPFSPPRHQEEACLA